MLIWGSCGLPLSLCGVGWGLHSIFCVQPNYSIEAVLWLCCVVLSLGLWQYFPSVWSCQGFMRRIYCRIAQLSLNLYLLFSNLPPVLCAGPDPDQHVQHVQGAEAQASLHELPGEQLPDQATQGCSLPCQLWSAAYCGQCQSQGRIIQSTTGYQGCRYLEFLFSFTLIIQNYMSDTCITRNFSTSETYCLKVLGERFMCDVGRVKVGGSTQPGKVFLPWLV